MSYKKKRSRADDTYDRRSSPKRQRRNYGVNQYHKRPSEEVCAPYKINGCQRFRREDSEHAIDTTYASSHNEEGHYRYLLGDSIGPEMTPSNPSRRRYKLLAKVGQGTFGRVFLCWDRQKACYLAVKVVRAIRKYSDSAMVEIDILNRIQNFKPVQNDNGDKSEKKNDVNKDDEWEVIPLQIERYDQTVGPSEQSCIRLLSWFKHHAHVCMVFENCGLSLYDFLKKNSYRPFELYVIRDVALQLFKTLHFLHDRLRLIHTDLKPENILFAVPTEHEATKNFPEYSGEFVSQIPLLYTRRAERARSCDQAFLYPEDTKIKVIDLGSAVFLHEDRLKTSIVCTRHYRAPEVILRLGWSFPVDIWSAGTILLELYTGDTTFQTHNNVEHLAMMEKCIGEFPSDMLSKKSKNVEEMELARKEGRPYYHSEESEEYSRGGKRRRKNFSESDSDDQGSGSRRPTLDKYFSFTPCSTESPTDDYSSSSYSTSSSSPVPQYKAKLRYPNSDTSQRSVERVKHVLPLGAMVHPAHYLFLDFVRKCLTYDPNSRMTAAEALNHPFLTHPNGAMYLQPPQ